MGLQTLAFALGHVLQSNKLVNESDLLSDCMAPGGLGVYQCYFEAWERKFFAKLNMTKTGFLVPRQYWNECAPAENGTEYLTWCVQGQVSDNAAYANGGIAGHAGIFSTAPDDAKFMSAWLWNTDLIHRDVYKYWITEYNHSQSSRAIGWDTNDPLYSSLTCGDKFPATTFCHTGYTGTQLCGDPEHEVYHILLTNRVYPTDAQGSTQINAVRRQFGNAVADTLGFN